MNISMEFSYYAAMKCGTNLQKIICRNETENGDMWARLEHNWSHFYWLTGEIPPTLNLIVGRLETRFRRRQRGPKCKLTFLNQV